MQELYLLSPLLIKTINEKLDQPHIKEIRFKQVSLKKDSVKKLPVKTPQKKEVTLSKEEKQSIVTHVIENVDKRVPIVLGLGGNNTQEILNSLKKSSELSSPLYLPYMDFNRGTPYPSDKINFNLNRLSIKLGWVF